jgi:uronate dehydrogenase
MLAALIRRALGVESPVRRLVVTGAAGSVGTMVAPLLAARGYALRLLDRRGGGAVARADVGDAAHAALALRGQEAVLHLAAVSKEAPTAELVGDNAVAFATLLRAAAAAGIRRFVFASTMHVFGLYGRGEVIDESSPLRPDSHYAASKVYGEALCRLHAEKCGMTVTVLRLGHVAATLEEAEPACWISPEDVAQLVHVALTRDGPPFEVFNAVADYAGAPLAPSRAAAYGYVCLRPAEPYDRALKRLEAWTRHPVARERRGAKFASRPLGG